MMIGWDKPWDLAREIYKREGVEIKELARLFGQQQCVIRQWVTPRPCAKLPLAKRAEMLRKMGVSWRNAAWMLGFPSAAVLRQRIGDRRKYPKLMKRWRVRHLEALKKERIACGRA